MIDTLHDLILFISLKSLLLLHFNTKISIKETYNSCILYLKKTLGLDKKLTDQISLSVFFPDILVAAEAVCLRPKLSSHEKLFRLPSTRVIVTNCERQKQNVASPVTARNVSNALCVTSPDSDVGEGRSRLCSNCRERTFYGKLLVSGRPQNNYSSVFPAIYYFSFLCIPSKVKC
jgi:hypothetical protein